ncbi:MAG: hypothetical protein AAGG02_19730 [Cyanobacteria bacterium P01_H01_bin.15]
MEKQIPKKPSREQRKAFGQKIIQAWLDSFHLERSIVFLSLEEVQALDEYYYAVHLMILCKQAAIKVSPETWQEIEGRMLRPNPNY